jgi:hypothetical protein
MLAACRPARDPHELRLGYAPNLTHAQALVGLARGDFERALPRPWRLAGTPFNAGPAMVEALFAGELDVAYLGPIPAINGFVQSKGRALRIVSGSASGGSGLVVRRGSGIETDRDLAGHAIAVPQFGGTQDVALTRSSCGRGSRPTSTAARARLSVPNSGRGRSSGRDSSTPRWRGALDRTAGAGGGRRLWWTSGPSGRALCDPVIVAQPFLEASRRGAAAPEPRPDHRIRGREPRRT